MLPQKHVMIVTAALISIGTRTSLKEEKLGETQVLEIGTYT